MRVLDAFGTLVISVLPCDPGGEGFELAPVSAEGVRRRAALIGQDAEVFGDQWGQRRFVVSHISRKKRGRYGAPGVRTCAHRG